MGSLFLFLSLAVLVGIVGLLAYYFKSRLAEVESKNLKSLEIIEGMYSQQQQMKQYILGGGMTQASTQAPIQEPYKHLDHYDERIKIVLEEDDDDESEDESEDESDDESEDESEDESDDEVKKITVDMSFPEECNLDIEEDDNEYIPEDEPEVNLDEPNVQSEEDIIVVNKLSADEDNKADEDFEITAVKSNDKDNYKKMGIAALKNILHSRGIVTDSARLNKMKKSEIIDLLLVASLAQ
jgi:membrane-associated HD superfamily phosphohydrolase